MRLEMFVSFYLDLMGNFDLVELHLCKCAEALIEVGDENRDRSSNQ
jgi:hypothetical protein